MPSPSSPSSLCLSALSPQSSAQSALPYWLGICPAQIGPSAGEGRWRSCPHIARRQSQLCSCSETIPLFFNNKIQQIFIPGPAGRLDAKYYKGSKKTSPIALILQPHPQYGGTMDNKIVVELFKTFADNEFSVCRINFRGVGKSDGEFDNGQGELADAAAALDWVEKENFDNSQCWVSGFSFGLLIGMQLLMNNSDEFGYTKGLGLIDGNVDIISKNESKSIVKLPNIGWYELRKKKNDLIFNDVPPSHWFYFVHSFKVNCSSEEHILANYSYSNIEIIAAIRDKNILGVQFHPENSGKEGLKILNNFCNA